MLFRRLLVLGWMTFALALGAAERSRPTRPAAPSGPDASYRGAIVLDATTGKVLFEDRADVVSPPASMTKLMTFAVVYDALQHGTIRLDTPVKITNEDAKMGGTQVFLDPRETFPVEDLIYAMMIQSANDASHALARATAGSGFVELMNAKARELGMTNTTFRSPHGLPPPSRNIAEGDLTTPRDFALLSRHLVQRTDALKYTSVRMRQFGQGTRAQPMNMVNHNHLIGKVDGVDGLKTGFTNGAGFCLSATALRGGRRVIVVTMGSAQAKARDLKVAELIERGFAVLPPAPVAPVVPLGDSAIVPAPAPKTAKVPSASASTSTPASTHAPAPAAPAAAPAEQPMIKFSIPKK